MAGNWPAPASTAGCACGRRWLQPAGDTALPDAGALYRLAWANGDSAVVIATQRHGLLLWPGSNGPARPLGREGTPVLDLALAPDGQTLASTDKDGRVFLWDMISGEPLHAPCCAMRARSGPRLGTGRQAARQRRVEAGRADLPHGRRRLDHPGLRPGSPQSA
jgi:hypothetical protein